MTPTAINPLNGHLWKVLRWAGFGAMIVGSYFGLKQDIAVMEARNAAWREHVEYRMDTEFVTKDGMRRWIDEVNRFNPRMPEPRADLGGDR